LIIMVISNKALRAGVLPRITSLQRHKYQMEIPNG
jgi:hypothetical protein